MLKVDFPTPPLPESTRILCLTEASRAVMRGMSGSGPLGAEAHIAWLGHPAQESALPAVADSGPGQCSVNHVLVVCSSESLVVAGQTYPAQAQPAGALL